jgi:hypothetical protein
LLLSRTTHQAVSKAAVDASMQATGCPLAHFNNCIGSNG